MPRVKRGVQARARHKKVLKQAKGYYGARSRVYRVAFQAVTKAGHKYPNSRIDLDIHYHETTDSVF